MVGPSLLVDAFFGNKEFGAIVGVVKRFFSIGFAVGSSIFGLLVDNIEYTPAWYVILGFIVISYGLLIFTSIGMKKLNEKNN